MKKQTMICSVLAVMVLTACVVPHKQLDRKNHPEKFYDLEALGKLMDEYYK